MKSEFSEYYYDFEAMWKEAIFVFDANVLLNVYRFSPSASKDLLKIMNRLKDRIWIPYQFAAEYHRNSHTIMDDIDKAYSDKKGELEKLHKKTVKAIEDFSSPTSFNVPPAQFKSINGAFAKISDKLSDFENKHKESLSNEDIRGQIAVLFDGRVGKQTPRADREKIYEQGKNRYEDRIPPGYKDKDRNKKNPFGDLVGWFEMIEFANNERENKRPIIFISDDSSKDDWFHKLNDEAKGPRRELVDEMREKAGVDFYLYETWQLLQQANKYLPDLKDQVPEKTIEEAKHLSELRRQLIEERHRQERPRVHFAQGDIDVWDWADDSNESEYDEISSARDYNDSRKMREYPSAPASVDDIPF